MLQILTMPHHIGTTCIYSSLQTLASVLNPFCTVIDISILLSGHNTFLLMFVVRISWFINKLTNFYIFIICLLNSVSTSFGEFRCLSLLGVLHFFATETWNLERRITRLKIFNVLIIYLIFIYVSFSKGSYRKGERNPGIEQDISSF